MGLPGLCRTYRAEPREGALDKTAPGRGDQRAQRSRARRQRRRSRPRFMAMRLSRSPCSPVAASVHLPAAPSTSAIHGWRQPSPDGDLHRRVRSCVVGRDAYRDRIVAAGGLAYRHEEPRLVHSYLRARPTVARACEAFTRIVGGDRRARARALAFRGALIWSPRNPAHKSRIPEHRA
jgi:hypothetical protein